MEESICHSGRYGKRIFVILSAVLSFFALSLHGEDTATAPAAGKPGVRKLHFIQDDAQDYMVSKLYQLKYVQSTDLVPFVSGIVMRYNMNSTVNSIEYGNNGQWLTVTCPVKMMPYVDDFIAKADRNVKVDGRVPGDIIRGTGITRAVYRPLYRSGQTLLNVLVNSVIGAGPYSSVYAWDKNSNQIYWKDNESNTQYVYQFLTFLDRPAPQITLNFTVYEVRESKLRDLGIEYLAWKNGPGLNIFQTAFQAFSISSAGSAALQAASGPLGGFFFAPQFDASFIRMLQQSGNAEITSGASLTVSNSETAQYGIWFNPQLQNIIKSDNDYTSVTAGSITSNSNLKQVYAKIIAPTVNIHYGTTQAGYPADEAFEVKPYAPGNYVQYPGTLFFGYEIVSAAVVERNNAGAELIESGQLSGNCLIPLNTEYLLGIWELESTVEQIIGVPWLIKVPILRYIFGTVTKSREKTRVCVTVKAELLNTAKPDGLTAGVLKKIK